MKNTPSPNMAPLKLTVKNVILREDIEALKQLLAQGNNVNKPDDAGWAPVMHATYQVSVKCLALIIDAGADVNAKTPKPKGPGEDWTAASIAATKGSTECLALLIKAGADVDAKNRYGWTAAMCAAYRGHSECLGLLISAGSDLSRSNRSKKTALMLAESQEHTECAQRIRSAVEAQCLKASLSSISPHHPNQRPRKLRV